MKCKLSIITISYKSPSELILTGKSINLQDTDIEWIIIDGGGCNQSKLYLHGLPPSVDWSSESDRGIYDAMGKGLLRAKGDHVLFINSGDEISDWIALKNTLQIAHNFDVLFAASVFVKDNIDIFLRLPRLPSVYIYHSVPGNQQSTIYRRTALLDIGIPTEYPLCGDYALSCKLFRHKYLFGSSNNKISRFHLGGASSMHWRQLMKEAWLIQKYVLHSPFGVRFLSFCLRFINIFGLKLLERLRKK